VLEALVIACLVAAGLCFVYLVVLPGWRDAKPGAPLAVAVLLLLVGAATAAVDDKVAAPDAAPASPPAPAAAQSDWPLADLAAFRGAPRLHSGPLRHPLCLVRYFARRRAGDDPGATWWTTCAANRALKTVAMVRRRLALLHAWGPRNARVFARIPAGASVVYLEGKASQQCAIAVHRCYRGGGLQLLFRDADFDRGWFTQVECASKPERAPHSFVACRG
jgi:hypothetical protein